MGSAQGRASPHLGVSVGGTSPGQQDEGLELGRGMGSVSLSWCPLCWCSWLYPGIPVPVLVSLCQCPCACVPGPVSLS